MTIQAIETRYAGCRFRSRLEARWAVFFDHLGIAWEYEPQGFEVGFSWHRDVECDQREVIGGAEFSTCEAAGHLQRTRYLPDFYLIKTHTWVEVKGELTNSALTTIVEAMDWGVGLPGVSETHATGKGTGLLVLGPVPKVESGAIPAHPLFTHHKGVLVEPYAFASDGELIPLGLDGPWSHCWFDASVGGQEVKDFPHWPNLWFRPTGEWRGRFQGKTQSAYTAARSARFEHGESGSK